MVAALLKMLNAAEHRKPRLNAATGGTPHRYRAGCNGAELDYVKRI